MNVVCTPQNVVAPDLARADVNWKRREYADAKKGHSKAVLHFPWRLKAGISFSVLNWAFLLDRRIKIACFFD